MQNEDEKFKNDQRPPIVVVMGHIDHGKTTILDYYRKTKIVERESGGITQHIGAYVVEHEGKTLTFIDTPGHEAFSKMRLRGAHIADIAVLVIAADEGVKPQTKEALEIIRESNLSFVVALNKIDKPEANSQRVSQELAEAEVLLESYGGKVPSVEISAKTGQGTDELLEILLLLSELEHLEGEPGERARGAVIEVLRDSRRGITATLLVRQGTFRKQSPVLIGQSVEVIKILEDFRGMPIEEAGPSSPVVVAGLSRLPAVGEPFEQFPSRAEAERFAASQLKPEPEARATEPSGEGEKPIFNIIIKADVAGSEEAVRDLLQKIESDTIGINILASGVGDINESDAKRALATKLVTIVGFRVKIDPSARELAEQQNIRIVLGTVIYELLEQVKTAVEQMIPPEIRRTDLGRIKILRLFRREGTKQIVGGRVEEGVARKDTRCDIKRMKEVVGTGAILQVQREKTVVDEAPKGSECGVSVDSKTPIQEGDVIEVYQEEVVRKKL
ncbi:MAG: translation initiation factor IF-2 [Candidatus Sungbacteria bacterium]|nr:translation initiation factor IF-2 [Candidatus Sungbacteria bacterium]